MCKVLYLLLLVFLPSVATAQEDVKRVAGDSLRTGTAGEAGIEFVSSDVGFVLPDKEAVCPSDGRLPVSDSLFHLSLKKPLVPSYYINPSPLLRGDYNTGGILLRREKGAFYGAGGQATLPGIGIMNEASLGYVHQFNDQWSMQVGVDALKMNMPFAVGQSLGTSGVLMYRPSERIAFKVFGSYYRGSSYGMQSHSYGGSLTVGMSDRFSMEMGVRRHYNPLRGGWETVPIVAPCYKFDKFDLGIDLGGILYELLHKVVIDKNRMNRGNPTIGPPSYFQMQGR
ncbi:MAG: hypothetical protein K2P62_04310 [Phocaeicola sp.]|nr:hypothetical protein [Phocaeicola sp.]